MQPESEASIFQPDLLTDPPTQALAFTLPAWLPRSYITVSGKQALPSTSGKLFILTQMLVR